MKQIFEITDQVMINQVLDNTEFGTLAICSNNKPYSLPINFVRIDNEIYFHGSKKGRKIDILIENQLASFSVVEAFSVIQSYFSSRDKLACPATQFFKSVMIDGKIKFVENYTEKVKVLSVLMQKLQPEGKYSSLDNEVYEKAINATTVYKLIPDEVKAKFKFGQHLTKERFNMIVEHLENRNEDVDKQTIALMKKFKY